MEVITINNDYYLYRAASDKYVIFVHGMVETMDGYLKIKDFLVASGYNVVLYNQRSHGVDGDNLAHYSAGDAYNLVTDLLDIAMYLRKENQARFICVVGHSMGTYVTRNAMKTFQFDKVVLNGMPKSNNLFTSVISSLLFLGNKRKRTKLFDKVVFKSYNKRIKNPTSEFSWICSNEAYMQMYLNSDYCGVIGTKGFYQEIIKLSHLALEKDVLPTTVMLTTGYEDPVSEFGKVCDSSANRLEKCGCNVVVKKYDKMRHFIYDEIGCEVCYNDLLEFLKG